MTIVLDSQLIVVSLCRDDLDAKPKEEPNCEVHI